MAEIKSSIEIAMEKARRMEMSDEEKQKVQRKRTEEQARGLLNRLLAGELSGQGLRTELEYKEKQYPGVSSELVRQAADEIDFEGGNRTLLELMDAAAGPDAERLKDLTEQFTHSVQKEKKGYYQAARKRLAEKGVSGSAVIPNMATDEEWNGYLREMRDKLRNELARIMRSGSSAPR
jgi:hypothetical protein